MKANWLTVHNRGEEAEILLDGVIGESLWDESGMSSAKFNEALAEIPEGKPVVIGINSPGGSVADGLAIHNAIKRRGNCTTRIDGAAWSSASIVFLAGAKRIAPMSASLMIHEPWSSTSGDAAEHQRSVVMLNSLADTLAEVYAGACGLSKEECRDRMRSEWWLTGSEAREFGFATESPDKPVTCRAEHIKAEHVKTPPGWVMNLYGLEAAGPADTNHQQSATVQAEPAATISPDATTAEGGVTEPQSAQPTHTAPMPETTQAAAAPAATASEPGPLLAAINRLAETVENLNKPAPVAGVPPVGVHVSNDKPGDEILAIKGAKPRFDAWASNRDKLRSVMGANTFTTLTNTILTSVSLEAFTAAVAPLNIFSTNLSGDAVAKGDKVKVFYTGAASAATSFNGTYVVQGVSAEGKDVTIDKRQYVSWGITTEELYLQPQLNIERFATQKGFALAKAVLQDIWSLITSTNYGSTAYSALGSGRWDDMTVAASAFASATHLAALGETCDLDNWPENMRGLVLSPSYYWKLMAESALLGTLGLGNSQVLQTGTANKIYGFDMYVSNLVPSNSDYLTCFAAHPDSILVAMRSLIPDTSVRNAPAASSVTGPGGQTIVLREWFEPSVDTTVRVLECNYGYAKGNSTGTLKHIHSA